MINRLGPDCWPRPHVEVPASTIAGRRRPESRQRYGPHWVPALLTLIRSTAA